jgi:hypothetical protein
MHESAKGTGEWEATRAVRERIRIVDTEVQAVRGAGDGAPAVPRMPLRPAARRNPHQDVDQGRWADQEGAGGP